MRVKFSCLNGGFTPSHPPCQASFHNMFGSHATSPRPSPPTPVGGEGESCAVFLKNPRRDWPEVHPPNQNRPLVISSWQSATRAHGLSAPEARPIVAHGETVGLVVNLIQAPDGATENQPTDIFFRPSRGLIRLVRLTHGSRRGLLSAVAPRLRTLRVLRATKPHPLFNPVRLWSGIPVFRQPRQGRNLCSHRIPTIPQLRQERNIPTPAQSEYAAPDGAWFISISVFYKYVAPDGACPKNLQICLLLTTFPEKAGF